MEEAARSIRVSSTQFSGLLETWQCIGFTLGGFVAGEGWFTVKSRGARFVGNVLTGSDP